MTPRAACLAAAAMTLGCETFAPRAPLAVPAAAFGLALESGACPREAAALAAAARPAPDGALPADVRRDFACLSLRDNLARDERRDCAPPVASAFSVLRVPRRRIVGDLAYVAADPREYAYDLASSGGGGLRVEVRIHFRGEAGAVARTSGKLAEAAAFWTRHSPPMEAGRPMEFRFYAVEAGDNPHYEIDLKAGEPRTPFDLTWGTEWSTHLIAHELGHMMGLDDEYGQIKKTWGHAFGHEAAWRADAAVRLEWLTCDLHSLMCDSKGDAAVPLPHHYYVIARRRFCAPRGYDFSMGLSDRVR